MQKGHLLSFLKKSDGDANANTETWSRLVTGRNEVVAKVMFLLVCVILFTGGSASVHAEIIPTPHPRSMHPTPYPREACTPWEAHTPRSTPPLRSTHPSGSMHPIGSMHPLPGEARDPSPPPEADSGIQSMSGRYASYWNAFFLCISVCSTIDTTLNFDVNINTKAQVTCEQSSMEFFHNNL